jgi:hypothetical protein
MLKAGNGHKKSLFSEVFYAFSSVPFSLAHIFDGIIRDAKK